MYNKLVLTGGGQKGSLYIGMLKYFEEHEIILEYLNEAVGTSIGALICLLIVLGYNSSEISELFLKINFEELKDISLINLETGFGFDKGEKINDLIKFFIKNKGHSELITLSELYKKSGIVFACTSYNVSKKKGIFFDHINYPDIPVYLAVRASMNIPILFCAVEYKGDLYCDGCIFANLPIRYLANKYAESGLDKETLNNILSNTLSVCFEEINYHSRDNDNKIINLEQYMYNLLKSTFNIIETNDKKYIIDNKLPLLVLKTNLTSSASFYLSIQQKKELLEIGYNLTKDYFLKYN